MRHFVLYLAIALAIVTPIFAQGGGTPTPGNRLFNDDFATFVNRWESTETDTIVMGYEAQSFQVDLKAPTLEIVSRPNTGRNLPRFVIETDVHFRANSATDSFGGIMFGYQDDDNFYVFGIRPSGHYEVHLKVKGLWQEQPLVRGFYGDLLNEANAVYRLQITYDGGRYSLGINAKSLVPFYDVTLGTGEFGLYAQSGSDGAYLTFDNYVVYDLVYAASTATPVSATKVPTLIPLVTVTHAPTETPIPSDTTEPDVTPSATDVPEATPTPAATDAPDSTPNPTETPTIPRI